MMIEQTIEIPASRALEKAFKETANLGGIARWMFHPIRAYHDWQWRKTVAWLDECQRGGPLFGGIDGLEYQRHIRNEWKDSF
jgi:hypothetical protein